MITMDHFPFILVFLLLHLLGFSSSLETLVPAQSLADGETLVSQDGVYELGFFSPNGSRNRFLGIWYKNIPERTVVWIANRDNPINGSSGSLTLTPSGNLVLLSSNSSNTIVWSTNTTSSSPMSSIVELLGTGNLVLHDGSAPSSGTYLWQSFDYPTDTFLPDMKIGWDLRTGLNRRLVAWKSPSDPSSSDFTWGVERHSYPESIAWKGPEKYFRSGPWNGLRYSGAPEQKPNALFWFKFVWDKDEIYSSYGLKDKSVLTRNVLNRTTYAWERSTWSEVTKKWILYSSVPKDKCDNYNSCGPHGNCNMDDLGCQCLEGFSPKSPDKWASMDWSQGCKRDKPLECGGKDGFKKFSHLKLPDTTFTWVNASLDIKECRERCSRNCSCTAYTHSDIRGSGSGCALWFGDLMDIRSYSSGGQDLHIRMAASELGGEKISRLKIAVAAVAAIVGALGIVLMVYYFRRGRIMFKERTEEKLDVEQKEDMELPAFDLAALIIATSNFSFNNKLGEGGFGLVYKGTLPDGQEIAVKRLSIRSGQGVKEFKNEVILIAKLQHRNLVRLLGCCIQGEEKMLVYEYMPNKSLDTFIFDDKRGYLLDWPTRFNIICGVARGLLYLHQDSRLRIIHRDLKASNVLLDKEMNPKISDFGMARTFGGDQSEGSTNRVVGTYGYMAPEYATDGLFSVKSDVFSFGILVLEIISGRRNRGIFRSYRNLIGHAWRLYSEGRPLEMMDPVLESSADSPCRLLEVMRCIQVSFLCLQQWPEDRPSMASVAVMLGSDGPLPDPKQPGFAIDCPDGLSEGTSSSSKLDQSRSVNEITITQIKGR